MHQSIALPQPSSSKEQPHYLIRTPPSWLTRSPTSLAGDSWGAERPHNDAARSGRHECGAPAAKVLLNSKKMALAERREAELTT